jgi:cation diffusion facilitator family transporter
MASESRKTVLIALGANAGIGVIKFAAGILSGSSAMLAEAAHSVADTTNQIFLLASLSFSERRPDAEHPFGYGKERFLWSFMAAIFIFVSGSLFSFYQGISELLGGEAETGGWGFTYAALAAAFVLEGTSLIRAMRQTRQDAGASRRPLGRYVRTSRDPTTKTVVFEDSAAVTGVVIAGAGVALHQITGHAAFDAAGAILIGCLLAVVAVGLWRDTRGLLIGEAALPEEREAMQQALEANEHVDGVIELLTMALGPDSLLVAARLDLADGLDSDGVEALAADLEGALSEAVPAVRYVFLDPTSRKERPPGSSPERDGRSTRV